MKNFIIGLVVFLLVVGLVVAIVKWVQTKDDGEEGNTEGSGTNGNGNSDTSENSVTGITVLDTFLGLFDDEDEEVQEEVVQVT